MVEAKELYDLRCITGVDSRPEGVCCTALRAMMTETGGLMYTILLIGCILALTLWSLVFNAILSRIEGQSMSLFIPRRRHTARLTLASTRLH